jgi:hypothetical protein
MNPSMTNKLMSYLGQYVLSCVQHIFIESDMEKNKDKNLEIPEIILNILIFLDFLCFYLSLPLSTVHAYVPPYIIASIKFSSMKKS